MERRIMYGLLGLLLLASVVFAFGDKTGLEYGMMGGYGWGLIKLVYLALASFVFSVVFWLTHAWLQPKAKKRRKKR